jgi:hypothetical protein
MIRPRRLLPLVFCLLPFAFSACGYHVEGNTDVLPAKIKTIAIPAFANNTIRYKISELLASALTREFISRTRYQIVNDPTQADAVLSGAVIRFDSYPTTLDPATGRASAVQTIVTMRVSLKDRVTNTVLFERQRFEFRQAYEITIDPTLYLDESDAAMDRLSREVARSVVSAILENF